MVTIGNATSEVGYIMCCISNLFERDFMSSSIISCGYIFILSSCI